MSQHASNAPESAIPADELADVVSRAVQITAAQTAQDAFSKAFRLTVSETDEGRAEGIGKLVAVLRNWSAAGEDAEAASLRMAMLLMGLDQWGVAYSKAFGMQAIPGLTELVGALRTGLSPREEALFMQYFERIDEREANVIDFKIELRRGIHLALWHAMSACEERESGERIMQQLGSLMLSLVRQMPELGWRLVADALAHIQIQCVSQNLATDGLAREMNEGLFTSLSRELPPDRRDLIMAHASRVVINWQQANRAGSDSVH